MPAKKSTGAPKAKTSSPLPSYIKTKEGRFDITKTATGKIKVTNKTGATITFPKGTNINKIASRLQSGDTIGGTVSKVPGTKIKNTSTGAKMKIRGGGLGGAFLENLK